MSAVGQKVYGYASRLRHPNLVPFAKHELLENATSYRHQHRQSSQLSVTEIDGRSRLSRLWTPTGGISATSNEDGHAKLIRAGFIRQAHSGIFHMLPLGRRVQDKIEKLVDKYMQSLGASRLDLSSISSQDLWTKSGRLSKINSELFLFKDRKEAEYLLSPTHEEEITTLVASSIKSYKELPVRLYQISRKYRDELRPRHGLLRSREFVMKDLYTFDTNSSQALSTYHAVRKAYGALFDELRVPYLMAEADSGDMGGNLSHEFHFPTPVGEDNIISCTNCDYVSNEELAKSGPSEHVEQSVNSAWSFIAHPKDNSVSKSPSPTFSVWRGVSKDRSKLINVWYSIGDPSTSVLPEVNTHAVKRMVFDLDSGVEDAVSLWEAENSTDSTLSGSPRRTQIVNLLDGQLPPTVVQLLTSEDSALPILPPRTTVTKAASITTIVADSRNKELNLLRIKNGDKCPRCSSGEMKIEKAIELGHTFYLGTRYSEPLGAMVSIPHNEAQQTQLSAPIQMGCHGIGVSRMIGAIAETLSDSKGLNWPRVIAPYEVVIVPARGNEIEALVVYDELSNDQDRSDIVLDDRTSDFPWKMIDADLVGYPVIVVVGRAWKKDRACEVQCRRLRTKQIVPVEQLRMFVKGLLGKL